MQRPQLIEITDNRVHNTELTPYQRGMIMGGQALGHSQREMERVFNFPQSTIQYTIEKHGERNDDESKSRPGRPKKLSNRDKRLIIRLARKNPRITYAQLLKETGVICSQSTLYRIFKDYGLTNWLAKKRPLLTEEVAKKRYVWCLTHQGWDVADWSNIMWSDECSVEKGSGKQREWVFRFPQEKWSKEMIQPFPKGKGVSVMVWAAFWGEGRSDLYRLARDFEAKKMGYSANSYIKVLEDNLLSHWEPGLIFMQNNAPIHTAKQVTKWFENNGIIVIDWPPYSPDLNPIEHV